MQTVLEAYREKIASGKIASDPVQLELVEKFDRLVERLADRKLSAKSSSLGWLFGRKASKEGERGLYVWGSVGRGKSMLMDMFFAAAPVERKRRVHFHEFMSDAQNRIHAQRLAFKEGRSKEEDPIPPVARDLAAEASLLCFDEFSVSDIADAMILGRLFRGLFEAGVTVVATSNVAPDDLYKDGLNRQLFQPFIGLLKEKCEVFELDARTDYRLEKQDSLRVYFAPLGSRADAAFEASWRHHTGGREVQADSIRRKGRTINIPAAVDGAARFTFEQLCEQPLSAADYLAIAHRFQTIFIEGVPMMGLAERQYAKRFINLIDSLYDNHNKVVLSAAASPHALYQAKTGVEAFEFDRTSSRLIEMQSQDYLDSVEKR